MPSQLRFPRRRNDWADDTPVPPPPPAAAGSDCPHCARLRVFLAGVLLAAGLVVLHAAAQGPAGASAPSTMPAPAAKREPAVAQPVPPRPEPQVSALPAAASVPAPVAPAASASTLMLVYQTVPLPAGRVAQPYKPRELVRGGRGPYRFTLDGALPPGLTLDDQGRLHGTPTASGNYRLELAVSDAATPPQIDRAPYVLRILEAEKPKAEAKAAAKPRPERTVSLAQADRTVAADPPPPMTYLLTQEKLDALMGVMQEEVADKKTETASQAASAGEPAATRAPPPLLVFAPTTEQLGEMLRPLLNVEHPTLAAFQDSLRAARCAYYLRHVNAVGLDTREEVVTRCPKPAEQATPASAASSPAARGQPKPAEKALQAALRSGRLPLATFHDMLMPAATMEEIVKAAGVEHAPGTAQPLKLTAADGCGCALPDITNDVFGFLPYWTTEAHPGPMAVRFDKFTRLQYMGVLLRNNGDFLRPTGWNSPGGRSRRQGSHYFSQ